MTVEELIVFLTSDARGDRKLSLDAAMQEINELSSERALYQALIKYYDSGLRAKDLKTEGYLPTIGFLTSEERGDKKLSSADAVMELNGLTAGQLRVLRELYDVGLRGDALRKIPWRDSSNYSNDALLFLINVTRSKQCPLNLKKHIQSYLTLLFEKKMYYSPTGVLSILHSIRSDRELDQLITIEPFICKLPNENMLEMIASNPYYVKLLFGLKFVVKQQRSSENPTYHIYCQPSANDKNEKNSSLLRKLFAHLNNKFPVQMRHFVEELYTKQDFLDFAIIQLSANGGGDRAVAEELMQYLASKPELLEKNALMSILADYLKNTQDTKKTRAMKFFVDERLKHLSKFDLLIYFEIIDLMPSEVERDAPHHHPTFFTVERVKLMHRKPISYWDSLNLSDDFKQAFRVISNEWHEQCQETPHIKLSLLAIPKENFATTSLQASSSVEDDRRSQPSSSVEDDCSASI